MFFKLPFKGLQKAPSSSNRSFTLKRSNSLYAAIELGKNIAQLDDIKQLWFLGDEQKILEVCRSAVFEHEHHYLISVTDVYNSVIKELKST